MAKKLKEILNGVEFKLLGGPADAEISAVAYDSRECSPGSLFFCIPGFAVDGHVFVAEALARGASALVVSRPVEAPADVPVIQVDDPRLAMGMISSRFFGEPSNSLFTIGVTGTNGKTSTAFLIDALLREAGKTTGLLGTVENRIGDEALAVKRTTPESLDLHYLHSRMVAKGCTHVVMEVSSHALALKRVAGCMFDVATFSNLTQDHLDFHKDLDSYFSEKKKLFFEYLKPGGSAVVNVDDPRGLEIAKELKGKALRVAIDSADADVRAVNACYSPEGISFRIECERTGPFDIVSPLCGKFNIHNSLTMIGFAISQGIAPEVIASTLAKMKGVPGRFEKIEEGQPFSVIVDYAHSPDGIENVLSAAREICEGRLIVVFGAGGDRDKAKRPLMGMAAAKQADTAIITSDNPRSEEPIEIIDRIVQGLEQALTSVDRNKRFLHYIEADRFSAIKKALGMAGEKDVVVIAGKGHENYQIFKDRTIHFDDREVARNILREMRRIV